MAYRETPQPDGDCCLGGYCWRKFCPDKASMRRYIVSEALRRDIGRNRDDDDGGAVRECDVDIPELDDDDRD